MKQFMLQPASAFAFVALLYLSPLNAQQPNPKDFAVPDIAFRDFDIHHKHGDFLVRSGSFSSWLGKTGDFGQLVALHDQRNFNRVSDISGDLIVFDDDKQKQATESNRTSFPDDRVCDIAYVILRKNYNVKPLDYRYSLKKRDELIATLIARLRTPAEDREYLIPKPKPSAKE